MGNHFVPQYYLKGFESQGGIWVHGRQSKRSFVTQVRVIANENRLYSEEIEAHFNIKIEIPANEAFRKLRERAPITGPERAALAKYILVLWKRVPKARERALLKIPEVAHELGIQMQSELDSFAELMPHLETEVASLKARVETAVDAHKASPSPSIWYESIDFETDHLPNDALLSMNWVFLYHDELQFLTSDNPVFFFEFEGIGSPTSELTFPISSSLSLWATRAPGVKGGFVKATNAAVKEINRRTAFNSNQWVYSQRNERWILPFVTKNEWSLTRLR
ncbi:hypothetical protein CSQ96_17440 [Janthinobacterium sp. BJB412]|nr:hypothetical protein CSQ96_17440 [Janthinobacterium sp. BJB412]